MFDAHADYPTFILHKGADRWTSEFLPKLRAGGITAVVNAIFLEAEELLDPKASALAQLKAAKDLYGRLEDTAVVTNLQELEEALHTGRIAMMFSLEGAEPIETPDDLQLFYEQGVRFLGLSWSRPNRYAHGCDFDFPTENPGLSAEGQKLLEKAQEIGFIIDVSHLSDEGTMDVLRLTKAPIIASHSNSRSLTNVPRNLPDDFIKAIAVGGGLVGLNAASSFVSEKEKPGLEDLKAMLLQMLKVAGEDHVGFGFDLCDELFREDTLPSKNFDTLPNHAQAVDFVELLKQDLSAEVLSKVLSKNWLRLYRRMLP